MVDDPLESQQHPSEDFQPGPGELGRIEPARKMLTPQEREASRQAWARDTVRHVRMGKTPPPLPEAIQEEPAAQEAAPAKPYDAYQAEGPSRTIGGEGSSAYWFPRHYDPRQMDQPAPPTPEPRAPAPRAPAPGLPAPQLPAHEEPISTRRRGEYQSGHENVDADVEWPPGGKRSGAVPGEFRPPSFPHGNLLSSQAGGGQESGLGELSQALAELARIGEEQVRMLERMVSLLELIKTELPKVGGLT